MPLVYRAPYCVWSNVRQPSLLVESEAEVSIVWPSHQMINGNDNDVNLSRLQMAHVNYGLLHDNYRTQVTQHWPSETVLGYKPTNVALAMYTYMVKKCFKNNASAIRHPIRRLVAYRYDIDICMPVCVYTVATHAVQHSVFNTYPERLMSSQMLCQEYRGKKSYHHYRSLANNCSALSDIRLHLDPRVPKHVRTRSG